MRATTGARVFWRTNAATVCALVFFALTAPLARMANAQSRTAGKDYLTEAEADRIRDAETPAERMHLFLSFAADRLAKFEYELKRTTPEAHRDEVLNGLLNAYVGCLDDAADTLDLLVERQADLRGPLKEMDEKSKDFLDRLVAIQKAGKEIDLYKDTLDDAIEGTQDARRDVADDQKQDNGPPVRRKQ